MTRRLLMGLLILTAGCVPPGPQALTGVKNVTTPEGWRGRRYLENGLAVSEEFDSCGQDGRTDLWRFYDKGRLLAEEQDRNGDDRIDCRANYNLAASDLRNFERDDNFDGSIDMKVEYIGGYRWQQTWDRNHDGTVDFLFEWRGPGRLLSALHVRPERVKSLQQVIPQADWEALTVDQDYDQRFEAWTRYHNGQPFERGVDSNQDGRPDKWIRVEPAAPVGTAPAAPAPAPQPAPAPTAAAVPTPVPPAAPPPARTRKPEGYTEITKVQPAEAEEETAPAPKRPSFLQRMKGAFRRRGETSPKQEAEPGAPEETPAARVEPEPGPSPTEKPNAPPTVRVRVRLLPEEEQAKHRREAEAQEKEAKTPAQPATTPDLRTQAPVPRPRPRRHPSADLEE